MSKRFLKILKISKKPRVNGICPYVTAESSHMQDICIHDNTINFEIKWSPNLQGLVHIANHFDLISSAIRRNVQQRIWRRQLHKRNLA